MEYIAAHPDLRPGFSVSDADLDAFFAMLPEFDASVDPEAFDDAERFVRYQLESEIALQAWGEAGKFQQLRDRDRQLARALEILRDASTPEELLRDVALEEPDGAPGP